jgi:hypothetical protein
MSTRSRIGIENQDGTTTSIYCHFDGMIRWCWSSITENTTPIKFKSRTIN